MSNRFGGLVADAAGAMARVLGYAVYYILRIIYRPRDRVIAIGVALALLVVLIAWLVFG